MLHVRQGSASVCVRVLDSACASFTFVLAAARAPTDVWEHVRCLLHGVVKCFRVVTCMYRSSVR